MMNDFDYEEDAITLQPGDTVVMYSDGITEAFNTKEEEFSDLKVGELLKSHRGESAIELIDGVFAAVRTHAADMPQADDMTMVVIRRLA